MLESIPYSCALRFCGNEMFAYVKPKAVHPTSPSSGSPYLLLCHVSDDLSSDRQHASSILSRYDKITAIAEISFAAAMSCKLPVMLLFCHSCC